MMSTKNNSWVYVKNIPGIRRKKQGKSFAYFDPKGKKITDSKILDRINTLAIPPAYTHVWICPNSKGHIQAIGRDNKNRKQYIYHSSWISDKREEKFNTLFNFGQFLRVLRKRIREELKKPPTLSKSQIICSILFLIDHFSVRIGNNTYAIQNETYGITTLRKKHLKHQKNSVSFKFSGKNKHLWCFNVEDKNIVTILKHCNKIPGYNIFKFYNEQHQIEPITSRDVNEFLNSLSDEHFTAKDFRTWIATREFFIRIIKLLESKNLKMKQVKISLLEVANLLGHTPAICKESYIHPQIWEWLKNGKLLQWKKKNGKTIKAYNAEKVLLLWLSEMNKLH